MYVVLRRFYSSECLVMIFTDDTAITVLSKSTAGLLLKCLNILKCI